MICVVNIRSRHNNSNQKYFRMLLRTSDQIYTEEKEISDDSAYQISVSGKDPHKFKQLVYYKIRDFSFGS